MVEDTVSEFSSSVQAARKIAPGPYASRHVPKSRLQKPRPQNLPVLVSPVQETCPEPEIEFGYKPPGRDRFVSFLNALSGLLDGRLFPSGKRRPRRLEPARSGVLVRQDAIERVPQGDFENLERRVSRRAGTSQSVILHMYRASVLKSSSPSRLYALNRWDETAD